MTFPGIGSWLLKFATHLFTHGSLKHATSSIITSIRCHFIYQRIMESCVLGSQALRPPVMMSTKPIKSASRAVPSHAGRYSQNSVTRYWSLEINYHTAPNNEHTALPILQKIISVPLRLLGSAEYLVYLDNSMHQCGTKPLSKPMITCIMWPLTTNNQGPGILN